MSKNIKLSPEELYNTYDHAVKTACQKELNRFSIYTKHIDLEDFHQDAWLTILQYYGAWDEPGYEDYTALKKKLTQLKKQLKIAEQNNYKTKIINQLQEEIEVTKKAIGYDSSLSHIRTWVINVVHSIALMYVRNQQAQKRQGITWNIDDLMKDNLFTQNTSHNPKHQIDMGVDLPEIKEIEQTERLALNSAKKSIIQKALKKLPKTDKEILIRTYYHNESDTHIAKKMNINIEQINKHRQDAIAKLRKEIQKGHTFLSASLKKDTANSHD